MRIGNKKKTETKGLRLDNNIESYLLKEDARNAPEQRRLVRRDRIQPSPYQPRHVFPEEAISSLAANIAAHGLVHAPLVRPHPTDPNAYELIAGEKRVLAMEYLGKDGRGSGFIERDPEGHLLVPVVVEEMEDARAHALVLTENLQRADLSVFELARGLAAYRDTLEAQGESASVRALAEIVPQKQTSISLHLQAADGITHEVLLAAGVISDGTADYERLALLKLQPLVRVAQAAAQAGPQEAALVLLRELSRKDKAAKLELQRRQALETPAKRHFQINIRTALEEVASAQARAYVDRMIPALEVLCERAASSLGASEADDMAASLERIAARLRMARRSE